MTAAITSPPAAALAPKKRNNRALTEFACRRLQHFALHDIRDDFRQVEEKNTSVRMTRDGSLKTISVFLFDEEILRLALVEGRALALAVSFTSFFDSYGKPSSTTCERLNGLLDCLGFLGFLPHGVRLFRGEHNTTYLGRGDEKVAVGEDFLRTVCIRPNNEELIFVSDQVDG
jgi:hypothetical protein